MAAIRLLVVAALCPFVLTFSDTVPLITWSSYSSNSLERLPSITSHSSSLLERILMNDDVCGLDAIVLAEQPGLHASDLRTLAPSSKLVKLLYESPSKRQFQYLTVQPDFDLATMAEAVSARCGFHSISFTPGSAPEYFPDSSKHVISINLPSLIGEVGGTRKDMVSAFSSQLADEISYLASSFPKYLVIYTGSLATQHDRRQSPEISPPIRPILESAFAPGNTTLPEGGILKRYQLLTPGLILALLVTLFILLPIVMVGFSALASIQSPLRTEASRGYSASEKKTQ